MFNKKNIPLYILSIGVIFVVSSFSNKIKSSFESNNDEELIKQYLLNDSPLYGYNRPKLWIHSKYEVNSRKWKSFQSRNSMDLNQDYLHLTIKTIINHCGEDFNICLIDDESFEKLLPNWDVKIAHMAEPMKSHYRSLGMAQLIYVYGGMAVPNSLICMKNLKMFYDDSLKSNKPFICESINQTYDNANVQQKRFIPTIDLMGANKNDKAMFDLVEFLKQMILTNHSSSEVDFKGAIQHKCAQLINEQQMTLIGGEKIGIKTNKGKPILLEDLCEEAYLDLHPHTIGLYIPANEVLKRTKYEWIAVMNVQELLNTNMIVSKYLKASITDTTNEYYKGTKERSVVSI
jgi:hypothetical protein